MTQPWLVHSPGEPPKLVRGAAARVERIEGRDYLVEVWSQESWAALPEAERPLRAQSCGDCWILLSRLRDPERVTAKWID